MAPKGRLRGSPREDAEASHSCTRMQRMRRAFRLPAAPAPWPQSTLQTTLWPRGHTQAREGTDEASSARPSMWRKSSFQSRRLDAANCLDRCGAVEDGCPKAFSPERCSKSWVPSASGQNHRPGNRRICEGGRQLPVEALVP